MSHNQPPPNPYDGGQQANPYAGGPPQPGPYGQQPGPYGQQPQQPGPYGQPQQQPGYSYPQGAAAPQAGYGYPQGATAPQAGYGYPGPGAPAGQPWPPQPPPSRGGLGKGAITGIVAGGLAVLAALVLGGSMLFGGSGGSEELTTPKTLLGGEYERSQDSPELDQQRKTLQDELPSDGTAVVGQYLKGGSPQEGALILSGAWGDIDSDPADMRKDALDGMAQGQGAQVVQKPQDFTSSDGDTLSCQVVQASQAPTTMYMPACAWADSSTMAVIAVVSPEYTSKDSVDLKEFSETVSKVKEETVKSK